MYILYNHDGSINKKFLNEFIQQGNSYANTLFVAIIDRLPSEYSLSAIATLPNGENLTIGGGENGSMVIDGITRQGKYFSLTSSATAIPGVIKINITATSGAVILATYTVILTVNETGLQSDDPILMTKSEYQNLIEALSTATSTINSKVPYENADQNVDLGEHSLAASSLSASSVSASEVTTTTLKKSTYTYQLPNESGTLVLASEVPGLGNFYTKAESDLRYLQPTDIATSIDASSTDSKAASAKAVWTLVSNITPTVVSQATPLVVAAAIPEVIAAGVKLYEHHIDMRWECGEGTELYEINDLRIINLESRSFYDLYDGAEDIIDLIDAILKSVRFLDLVFQGDDFYIIAADGDNYILSFACMSKSYPYGNTVVHANYGYYDEGSVQIADTVYEL